MSSITIDDIEYDIESLAEEAKAQIVSLQVVDRRIASLQEELAIHQTARNAYANALRELLPGDGSAPSSQISWPSTH